MTAPNSESGSLQLTVVAAPEGLKVGAAAADKVGFYGAAPVAQQAIGTLVNTTGMASGTSGLYTTTTKNAAFITAVADIQTALKNLGLSS
jgi:hypothetical protein